MSGETRVTKRSLARVFFRALFIQAAWNPRGMQNLGFASAMAPALSDLYRDQKDRVAAAR
ncbi:MAG: PTS system mannose/fructose/sorbose family transporter subunit IID, partial [Myxococcales bacterium]